MATCISIVSLISFLQTTLISFILTTFAKTSQYRLSAMEWTMVEKRGNHLVLNGTPYFANGFNTYWLMVFAADASTRDKVSQVFREAAALGFSACRTWTFNDAGWRALQMSPSVYDETVFQGLDFVVSEARKNKIRLILSLVNNWEDYGGKAQYVKWAKEAGFNLSSDDDFFSDPTVKGYYKNHVKTILTRVNTINGIAYKDDPTIFAWELMNEPRCPSDPSGDTLQAWIEEMASHAKSIDPRHLIGIGVDGFYGPSTPEKLYLNPNSCFGEEGTDFLRNHQVRGVDFASMHIYPDFWFNVDLDDVKTWIRSHLDDANSILGMPVVIGEFGVTTRENRFSRMFQDAFIKSVYETVWDSATGGGGRGGCFIWQLFPEGVEHMDDGHALFMKDSTITSHALSQQCKKLQFSKLEPASNNSRSRSKDADEARIHEEL